MLLLLLGRPGARVVGDDYFDCDYFDPDYFDTPDCAQPVTTGHFGRRVIQTKYVTAVLLDDDEAMFILAALAAGSRGFRG